MKHQKSIILGSDHAGYFIKNRIKEYFESQGIPVFDIGTNSEEPTDYPDYGHKIGKLISERKYSTGISICGSGNGINMTTNKYSGVRGAVCWNEEITTLARKHNDANVCSIPGRFVSEETAIRIVDIFLNTSFEGGRHLKRIKKIDF
jgi:ribose 5-phosphate isomerase B